MANLILRRFSTLEKYQNADIADGTFFVIVETGQLGVRKGEGEDAIDIISPYHTLNGFTLPEDGEELDLSSNDTLVQAFAKLEKKIMNMADNSQEALETAQTALNAVSNLQSGDPDAELEARVSILENQIVVKSEEEFEAMDGFNTNTIYYVYEND